MFCANGSEGGARAGRWPRDLDVDQHERPASAERTKPRCGGVMCACACVRARCLPGPFVTQVSRFGEVGPCGSPRRVEVFCMIVCVC